MWLLAGRFPEVRDGPSDPCHLRFFALPGLRRQLVGLGFRIRRVRGSASLWVKGLYPSFFRAPGVRQVYGLLARLRPSLFARDLLLVCTSERRAP